MASKKKKTNRVDALLDDLLSECQSPAEILGETGLLKQLSKRLVERALAGELNHHLQNESEILRDDSEFPSGTHNSRNGHSKKTVQSEQGEIELSIPRDRNSTFEPTLVPKHQIRIQ